MKISRQFSDVRACLIITALPLIMLGCGNSGGDSDEAEQGNGAPSPVQLSFDNPSINEGDNGTTLLTFTATLDNTDSSTVTVDYATSDDSATAGSDYTNASGSLSIPPGATSATLDITINGDTDVEGDESFILDLSNISSNATLVATSATGTIVNDDVAVIPPTPSSSFLNDTGVATCSDALVNGLECNSSGDGTDQFPGQDGEHGRDVTDNDDSDGIAGFSFTKLDDRGDPLGDQSADYATTPWHCVRDEVTGLIWEVKTENDGLHDKDWTYTWYNSSGINDGGHPGFSNGGQCVDTRNCDTQHYVIAVNGAQLCGFDDWRLPTRRELVSLMNFGASNSPLIDTNYFVNHVSLPYWSGSPMGALQVAFVDYSATGAQSEAKFKPLALRLVRGGQ